MQILYDLNITNKKLNNMKKNIFISIFCLLFFSQINTMAQNIKQEEEEELLDDSTIKTNPTIQQKDTIIEKDNFLNIIHQGFYIAKYEMTYKENGVERKIEIGGKTRSFKTTFNLSNTATDIKLKAWAMTGPVWTPWGEIYLLDLQKTDLNRCYRNTGTTLNRQWDHNCESNNQ
jgi:hypothetical protein